MAADPVNLLILKRMIRHAVFIERYKTGLVYKIIAMFNTEVQPDIEWLVLKFGRGTVTEARIKALASELKLLGETYKAMMDKTHTELTKLAFSEAEWHKAILNTVTPVGIDFTLPPQRVIKSLAEESFVRGRLIADWYTDLELSTRTKVVSQVRIGMIEGESVDQMIRRLRGTRAAGYTDGILNMPRHSIEAIVRTSVATVTNQVRSEIYQENDDLIKGEYWDATLDARTCPACAALDRQEFEVGEGPMPPLHWNCRCVRLVILKSWKELGINLKEAPEGERASPEEFRKRFDGKIPSSMSYGEWLRGQDIETQNEVLGVGRAQIFRRGDVSFDRFIDARNRPLTLSQLEKLEQK